MIAGASKNFAVYATCNEQSSNLNIHVTYSSSITNDEKKAINKWIKASNFPVIGRWGAINFDTCYLTKTVRGERRKREAMNAFSISDWYLR